MYDIFSVTAKGDRRIMSLKKFSQNSSNGERRSDRYRSNYSGPRHVNDDVSGDEVSDRRHSSDYSRSDRLRSYGSEDRERVDISERSSRSDYEVNDYSERTSADYRRNAGRGTETRSSFRSRRRVYDELPDVNSKEFFLDSDSSDDDYEDVLSVYRDEEKSFDQRLEEGREAVRSRHRSNVKKRKQMRFSLVLIIIDILVLLVLGILFFTGKIHPETWFGNKEKAETTAAVETTVPEESDIEEESAQAMAQETLTQLIATSDIQAAMYDYDAAVQTLSTSSFAQDPAVQAKIQEYQTTAASCVAFDNSQVTHVFFHILCVDTDRAFTNDAAGKDFNQVMTTIPEFEAILQQMYERGFVLVGLHDMAEIQIQEDGTEKMVKKQIMLPPGKKAFVMSEDDVCYYEYMEGKGFADKMVLDENGKLKLQYTDAAGNVSVGDYDIVPILDNFIEQHPDFSYRGAKAIIAFTGYNGVLGYRTDETYDESSPNRDPSMKANPNIAEDRETCKVLMQALVDDGYELASHSWGHLNFTNRELATLQKDTDRWERNVETLMPGNCDIILYPFGADIADWHPYTTENDKFNMLQNAGFRYFCNVDSNPAWVQFGSNFVRQGRRNLDGYRMWMDYSGQDSKLSDLMDVKTVFDTRRPTPITWN